jgi:hypothetical protein
MYLFGDQADERKGATLGGETRGESVDRGPGERPESKNGDRTRASQALLARIMELDKVGRSPEEIATQVLTTEPENLVFRAALLVEIMLDYARRGTEERAL